MKTNRTIAGWLMLLALATLNTQLFTTFAQNIFVSNNAGGTVSEFNSSGALINGSFISGLNPPNGLAFDSGGNLYVANYNNGTVSKYNSSGTLINATFASGLSGPDGLAFDSSSNLYVVNFGNNTISEFNSSGTLIHTISDPSLNSPTAIAVSAAPVRPAPAPALGIATVSNQPVVVWPASATNCVLQMTTNLASGNWVTVSNGIPFSGLQITNAPGTAFFRLQ